MSVHPCPHCPHRDPVACCWCGDVVLGRKHAAPKARARKKDQARYIRTFIQGEYVYGREGVNVWVCSSCGFAGTWGEGWMWFGSLMDLDDAKLREVLCPTCSKGIEAA